MGVSSREAIFIFFMYAFSSTYLFYALQSFIVASLVLSESLDNRLMKYFLSLCR
jgi:hypothetical protein